MKSRKKAVDRRSFLKGAAVGAAAFAVSPVAAVTKPEPAEPPRLSPPLMPAEAEVSPPASVNPLTVDRTGSDFMVDVIKSLGFDYVFANPGSSFRGLHESVINYGGNKSPEFITCCHEESSAAMAHGYGKADGKPAMIFAHGTVGLQHAAMAIYNAYCDRAPVYIVVGNILDATTRLPGVEWYHAVQDAAAMVRDYTKWDDAPVSLPHFAESAVRAYKIAMTPPTMPVVLVADGDLQENPIATDATFHIPKLTLDRPPVGDSGAVAEAARLLVAAENPVLVVDRTARTPDGLTHMIELAETLQAPVIDKYGRMNFPSRHPLNGTDRAAALIANADVIVGLEVADFWGATHSSRDQLQRPSRATTRQGAKLISITSGDLYGKSNYQDMQRLPEVDLAIAADADATLPSLIEAVKKQITPDRKAALAARGPQLATAHAEGLQRARDAAAYAWDASPVSTARMAMEVWNQIQGEDWSMVSAVGMMSNWPLRLWDFTKPYQYIGGAGGAGIGYGLPAAVGAALANKKYGRISVNFQNDGDIMYAPGALWTAAHHHIPLLSVMHNNRAYHQEVMQVQIMADRKSHGLDRAVIGTTITNPDVNYAKIADGMGVHAEGPITDPKDLAPAIARALAVVKKGEPALVDVHTQPR
jgi:acetolactate synthase-1/2/3 large subunit